MMRYVSFPSVRIWKPSKKQWKKLKHCLKKLMKLHPITIIVRWVDTKEDHAQHIQDVVSAYFLTQRIKPTDPKDPVYIAQTTLLQQLLVSVMKCKQTLDPAHVEHSRELLDVFIDSYFDEHGKEHLQALDQHK